jgi:hypothetical protein
MKEKNDDKLDDSFDMDTVNAELSKPWKVEILKI